LSFKKENRLYEAILSLETKKECKEFFYDLCTPSEIDEFSSRWLVARLLLEKKPYRQISLEAKVSTATIVRVARFVKYGNNGYKTILKRLNKFTKGDKI
jgi:TrpR-related protein YerC/YecD